MLSGCQPGITKAARILKRKANTTNKEQTDRQKQKTNKKTGTKCILIWENGSWLTTANVNAPSYPPTHECLIQITSLRWPSGVCLPWASTGGSQEGTVPTVDWFCLGPAQQRSCIASWGCGPSSKVPDLTIPPCGCHRTPWTWCCAPVW